MNAVKTGLTGRTVLLPTDDALIYRQHLDRHFSELSPATDRGKIYLTYKKDFTNLALQERRLTNHRKTHLAELQQFKQERIEKEKLEALTSRTNC
jgi:hypothetical protein